MKTLAIILSLLLISCIKEPTQEIGTTEIVFQAETNEDSFMIIWYDDKTRGVYFDQFKSFSDTIIVKVDSRVSLEVYGGELNTYARTRIYADGKLIANDYCESGVTDKFYCGSKAWLDTIDLK